MSDKTTIGEALEWAEHELAPDQLAAVAGINVETYWATEKGQPRFKLLLDAMTKANIVISKPAVAAFATKLEVALASVQYGEDRYKGEPAQTAQTSQPDGNGELAASIGAMAAALMNKDQKVCPHCQAVQPKNAKGKFCVKCGLPIATKIICVHCGTSNDECTDGDRCGECGEELYGGPRRHMLVYLVSAKGYNIAGAADKMRDLAKDAGELKRVQAQMDVWESEGGAALVATFFLATAKPRTSAQRSPVVASAQQQLESQSQGTLNVSTNMGQYTGVYDYVYLRGNQNQVNVTVLKGYQIDGNMMQGTIKAAPGAQGQITGNMNSIAVIRAKSLEELL